MSETSEHVKEFDCLGCGRHIYSICHPPTTPLLCGACLSMPGWFNDDKLRPLLDPEIPPGGWKA